MHVPQIRRQLTYRLGVLMGVFFITVIALIVVFASQSIKTVRELEERRLVASVDAAVAYIDTQYQAALKGEFTQKEAQTRAIEFIRSTDLRRENHFMIFDVFWNMLLSVDRPSLEGRNLSEIKDRTGKLVFGATVEMVLTEKAGFVEFYWPNANSDLPVLQRPYVKGFAPWGWAVIARMEPTRYSEILAVQFRSSLIYCGIIILLGLALALIVVRSIRRLRIAHLDDWNRLPTHFKQET